jgi:hypothetical protein
MKNIVLIGYGRFGKILLEKKALWEIVKYNWFK